MGIEIEAKLRIGSVRELESRLVAVGAERGAVVVETNTYFDTPDHKLRSMDQGLRLRVERGVDESCRGVAKVTYKGPCLEGELKRRTEIEVGVADPQAMADLIRAIGFSYRVSFEKRRCHWALGGCEVDIDTMPHLGHFVEIEGPTEQAVFEVRRRLGLEGQPLIRTSYVALLDEYLQGHSLAVDCVCLDDTSPA